MMTGMKWCRGRPDTHPPAEFPLVMFYRAALARDGYQSVCKQCWQAAHYCARQRESSLGEGTVLVDHFPPRFRKNQELFRHWIRKHLAE
jgi:hypothetical protein